ncbi:hypothetical protein QN277_001832 [Acacia crassicarpa]|uniref:AAA+ ATPase domain-containing protein n=1 Tax=Acacia crassicarpa TaxID=499986 RepID=A0AAE1N9I4_9FABA|nr:hypothetical protein QN277_001832 [Acacia crassicarpa]
MDPSSSIWDATKIFCCFLNKEAAYAYDLENNLKLLETKWERLQEKKQDVEAYLEVEENTGEKQRRHQVSGWLKRMESAQKEIKDIQVRGDKQTQENCLSKYCPKYCIASYKLGKNIAGILRKVDELESEGEPFCRDFKIALKHLHKPNEMPCGETVGLDLMFDKVWRSIEETNIGIIGLYGMGGVGKTTLLKKINNNFAKRSDFYIVWVVVSKSPNLDKIMNDIKKEVGIGDEIWSHCSNQDGKAREIYKVLKNKKFVLFLDDIWDRLDLEKVGVPYPKETNFQSKVLFTTRFEDVVSKMKAERTFKIEVLPEKEALELFYMKVGEETLKSSPIIHNIAQKMASKCKGLPLALSVLGSAMAGVKSKEAWQYSINNLTESSWTASPLENEVFFVLKFSYDRLPDEMHKKCFLYCASYPNNYVINVVDLIRLWIAEGFLDIDGMRSLHDMHCHAGSILEKLKCSCLLENYVYDSSSIPYIKIHDVIRDMALWIARDQDKNKNKIIVQEDAQAISQANFENWEMVERISIWDGVESWIQSKSWTSLKTLFLNFESDCAINGLQNIQYASQLKVLHLRRMKIVSAEGLGGLNLLEYLLLGKSVVMNALDLWRELKNLKSLKFFHLELSNDNVIPLGLISSLHQLKLCVFYLNGVRDEREEKKFVEELECSSNLEEVELDITTESGLNELLKSTKLQNCIYVLHLHNVDIQVNGPLLLATMSKMKHLQHLQLHHLQNVIDLSVYDTCRLSALQIVCVFYCNSIHHLTWLKYAPLLRRLVVENCMSIEEVIKGEIILKDEKDTIFPSLEVLVLQILPKLRSIHERVLSFPSLRSIYVSHCKNLKKLPFDSHLAKAKLRHIWGDQEWWDNLEWDDPATKVIFHSKFQQW